MNPCRWAHVLPPTYTKLGSGPSSRPGSSPHAHSSAPRSCSAAGQGPACCGRRAASHGTPAGRQEATHSEVSACRRRHGAHTHNTEETHTATNDTHQASAHNSTSLWQCLYCDHNARKEHEQTRAWHAPAAAAHRPMVGVEGEEWCEHHAPCRPLAYCHAYEHAQPLFVGGGQRAQVGPVSHQGALRALACGTRRGWKEHGLGAQYVLSSNRQKCRAHFCIARCSHAGGCCCGGKGIEREQQHNGSA